MNSAFKNIAGQRVGISMPAADRYNTDESCYIIEAQASSIPKAPPSHFPAKPGKRTSRIYNQVLYFEFQRFNTPIYTQFLFNFLNLLHALSCFDILNSSSHFVEYE